jgi:hypothetical protein
MQGLCSSPGWTRTSNPPVNSRLGGTAACASRSTATSGSSTRLEGRTAGLSPQSAAQCLVGRAPSARSRRLVRAASPLRRRAPRSSCARCPGCGRRIIATTSSSGLETVGGTPTSPAYTLRFRLAHPLSPNRRRLRALCRSGYTRHRSRCLRPPVQLWGRPIGWPRTGTCLEASIWTRSRRRSTQRSNRCRRPS